MTNASGPPVALAPPGAGEFAPFYSGYVMRIPAVADAVAQLRAQRDEVARLFASVPEDRAFFRYADGKWSIKELLGHLADAERIFAYRLLRVGRGDATPLPGFDEQPYVDAARFDRRPLADVLDEWVAVRNATAALAGGLPPDAWDRRGVVSGGPMSARALLYIVLGHTAHHLEVLADRYGLRSQ
jgi:hypothetical protein